LTCDRREHCRLAMNALMTQHPRFFKGQWIYHDLQAALYSTGPLAEDLVSYNDSQKLYTSNDIVPGSEFSRL
jgi:hypothetical protein